MSDDLVKQLRIDAQAYRESLAAPTSYDLFSLAYQWQDKKHRHVWDLCKKVEIAADHIEKLDALVEQLRDDNSSLTDDFGKTFLHQESRIEKLEAALREIAEQDRQTAHPIVVYIIAVARKALEGKDD